MVNLGHCYRKQQRWDDAIQVYERALGLCPGQAGTYAALGFTRHLKVHVCDVILKMWILHGKYRCVVPNTRSG